MSQSVQIDAAPARPRHKPKRHTHRWVITGLVVVLVIAMGFGTTVVTPLEASKASSSGVDPATFARDNYDEIAGKITDRAKPLGEVATAIDQDQNAAAKKYAVGTGPSATYSVKFTGTAGKADPETGYLPVTVDGMPDGVGVSVQTGPALLGTALRDATGEVTFPMFTNQLDYQSAGDELNKQLKAKTLKGLDAAGLAGKQVSVVGAFQPINPDVLLVMPVSIKEA
ncbi:DUF2291 domain-containing protein [Microlunatus elymi]|uniref:DUF2291 domain-containing protein n=1 Tax=Microlunatus elymi TaxID=2596828 RepID=A0A516PZP8_9ACTN|nr:DUF2291 family protein [Microlunatus elymi]QDP96656.1 DUF2291 domain-containing protein [Microlunatus elymi]